MYVNSILFIVAGFYKLITIIRNKDEVIFKNNIITCYNVHKSFDIDP